MTPEKVEAVNLAHKTIEEVRMHLKAGCMHFLAVGFLLSQAKKRGDHLILGYKADRINGTVMPGEEIYAYHELNLKKSTYYDYINVADTFGDLLDTRLELMGAGYTRIRRLLPFAKDKSEEEKEELLFMAMTASPKDFEEHIRENRGKPLQSECEHGTVSVFHKCEECGKVWPVTPK